MKNRILALVAFVPICLLIFFMICQHDTLNYILEGNSPSHGLSTDKVIKYADEKLKFIARKNFSQSEKSEGIDLAIDLKELCTEGQGIIQASLGLEESYLCLRLRKEGITKIVRELSAAGIEPYENETSTIDYHLSDGDNEITRKLSEEQPIIHYTITDLNNMLNEIDIYFTISEGSEYMYIFSNGIFKDLTIS